MSKVIDSLTPFNNYDWRDPKKASVVLNDEHAQNLKILKEQGIPSNLTVYELTRIFRIGAYLMHSEKDPEMSAKFLNHVYNELENKPDLKNEFNNNNHYYLLTNNLAYATINKKTVGAEDYKNSEKWLDETIKGTDNVEIRNFAQRIKGQASFAQAQNATDFTEKKKLVKKGIMDCTKGTFEMDCRNPALLSEVARTYNRNAVELLKLSADAPIIEKAQIIESALKQGIKAKELWEWPAGKDFGFYSGRTDRTMGEIYVARYDVTKGNSALINLNIASAYLNKALDKFQPTDKFDIEATNKLIGKIEEIKNLRQQQ